MEVVIPPTAPESPRSNVVSIAVHPNFVRIEGTPADAPPVTRVHIEGDRCWHSKFRVDPAARKVLCAACKVELDPIHVLEQLTTYDWTWIVEESKRFRAEHERLKGEVAKIRAARNALRRKAGE